MDNIERYTKRKVDLCFFTLSLFPVFSFVSVIISYICALLSGNSGYTTDFYLGFVLPQSIYSLIGLILFSFIPKYYGLSFSEVVSVKKTPIFDLFLSVPILLLINLFSSFFVGILLDGLSCLGINIFDYSSVIYIPENPFQTVLFFITVAVIPAISEEIIFRGILIGLFKEYGTSEAIVISSVAFALVHSTVQQIPTAFCVGLFLSFLYVKFNSIIPCIIGHLVTNTISAVFLLISALFSESICNDIYIFANCFLIICGVFSSIIFLIRRLKQKKSTENSSYVFNQRRKSYNVFISSFWFWLFCLIMVGQTVFYVIVLSCQS